VAGLASSHHQEIGAISALLLRARKMRFITKDPTVVVQLDATLTNCNGRDSRVGSGLVCVLEMVEPHYVDASVVPIVGGVGVSAHQDEDQPVQKRQCCPLPQPVSSESAAR